MRILEIIVENVTDFFEDARKLPGSIEKINNHDGKIVDEINKNGNIQTAPEGRDEHPHI